MNTRPWNENIWFSPAYVINELTRGYMNKSSEKILKRLKEGWICAIGIICWANNENTEWWIQLPKVDPPDALAMKFVPTEDGKGQHLSELRVEVFEISDHDDKESVEGSIIRKLKDKDYSGMTVIGFMRRLGGFNHESVASHIKDLRPRAGSVSTIVFEDKNPTMISYIQLFPETLKLRVDFGAYCKAMEQRDFIEVRRGMKVQKEDSTTTDLLTLVPESN